MSASEIVSYKTQGTQPNNFTMLPNMAFEDLSPTAYKLLAVYLDIAKTDKVYAKNSTVTKKLGVSSVNTMKKARTELTDKGYIAYSPGNDGDKTTTASVIIKVAWMWDENHKRMSENDTPQENTADRVSNIDTPLSNSDTMLSNIDTNKQELNKQELYKSTDNARAHEGVTLDESASVLVQEIDDSLKDIITLFKNVFPDYIERPNKPTFQQDAKKLQTLLDVHGYESLRLALEKCAGMTVQSPFAYLKTILEAPDHKQAVAVKEQTITAIVPYHQDAPVDNTPAMSDAEAQQALQEIRAQLKERGVKFKALIDDEKPEPDTQKDDAA